MEQLTQNLMNGEMKILEVPFPALNAGCVLVRNYYSLISAGTEEKTVRDARLGYIAKARARKDEVKKVIANVRTYGLKETYKMVMNKLDAPSALGYSCAGEVIAVADDVRGFQAGDLVACAGAGAVHAEVVCIPVNLCVKINSSVQPEHAAFTTLGAIAMQGVRQADLRLGENCVVIGLGLIGNLTAQLLRASGINVTGIDIDPRMVALAKESCDNVINRNDDNIEQQILQLTDNFGADAVIITASTSSTDPVDLAGELCRKKGRVVIVGNVPTGFKRKNYYQKELDLRMSSSYGPGRYDSDYEDQGIDYPFGYVRWTENRNMQAFVSLLAEKKINIGRLITHQFDFANAPDAYRLLLEKTEPYTGILLRYDTLKSLQKTIILDNKKFSSAGPSVGFIGAGSFAQNILLPAIKGKAVMTGIATSRANNARNIADKYSFNYCTGDTEVIFSDNKINTVFIATRHDSHADYILKSLRSGKNVFCEKPLCLNLNELEEIKSRYAKAETRLMVGFNRRFAPMINKIVSSLSPVIPVAINYRINAGIIPSSHWIHNPAIGGGRIIGELCHFIDLCLFLVKSELKTISANMMNAPGSLQDTLSVSMHFQNGSIANISYLSNGNKNVNKEYLEIFSGGIVAQLDDFKTLIISGKKEIKISGNQDKGHRVQIDEWLKCISDGKPAPITFNEIYNSTLATFRVLDSIAMNGQMVNLML